MVLTQEHGPMPDEVPMLDETTGLEGREDRPSSRWKMMWGIGIALGTLVVVGLMGKAAHMALWPVPAPHHITAIQPDAAVSLAYKFPNTFIAPKIAADITAAPTCIPDSGSGAYMSHGPDSVCRVNANDHTTNGLGKIPITTSGKTLSECFADCKAHEDCVGVEFNDVIGRCELWAVPVGFIDNCSTTPNWPCNYPPPDGWTCYTRPCGDKCPASCDGNPFLRCGNTGHYGVCLCVETPDGSGACIENDYCDNIQPCAADNTCTDGKVCFTAAGCCGFHGPHCINPCGTSKTAKSVIAGKPSIAPKPE